MPPEAKEENFENLTTKWCILKYNYLNKYVVSIAPFSTPACQPVITRITSPSPHPIQKTVFCMYSLFNFSSIFQRGQLTPFANMCGRPCFEFCVPPVTAQLGATRPLQPAKTHATTQTTIEVHKTSRHPYTISATRLT